MSFWSGPPPGPPPPLETHFFEVLREGGGLGVGVGVGVLARIYVVYTLFIPYFGCVLLGIDSLRGGLA